MDHWHDDVLAFMEQANQETPMYPSVPPQETRDLRKSLMREEVEETCRAIDQSDLNGILDGVIDTIYVALGTLVSYGLRPERAWELVQEANMAKLTGPIREDGKQLKPEGWEPPDIEGEIRRQMLGLD